MRRALDSGADEIESSGSATGAAGGSTETDRTSFVETGRARRDQTGRGSSGGSAIGICSDRRSSDRSDPDANAGCTDAGRSGRSGRCSGEASSCDETSGCRSEYING